MRTWRWGAIGVAVGLLGLLGVPVEARAATAGNRVTVTVQKRSVRVEWSEQKPPRGFKLTSFAVRRDGRLVASLSTRARRYDDAGVRVGEAHEYAFSLVGTQKGKAAEIVVLRKAVRLPAYLVGASNRSITPAGRVNVGGNGLGDGRLLPDVSPLSRGDTDVPKTERIRTRAIVFDDGREAIAIASIETQGMFAVYEGGAYGLLDMAAAVARRVPGLRPDHVLIAADHTHSGPDTIGAWGGIGEGYLRFVADRTVDAIVQAYTEREFADVRVGAADASDLIYNQSCSEALNQGEQAAYTGPELCATPGKDGAVRVVQADAPSHGRIATLMSFAAHATAGGGDGLHGDWPQFVSDAMATRYGGFGQAMVGALGGVQPCRPSCAFTAKSNPGYRTRDRKTAIVSNYMAKVDAALRRSRPVSGPVRAGQTYIREPVVGAPVALLFAGGSLIGAKLLRANDPPWAVGPTVQTVAATLRVGGVVFAGMPGEGYHAIAQGMRNAIAGEQEVIPLGLANDQVGYLISPARYYPVIAAEVAVNDNTLFNVSPTIGDHVMCADIRLAAGLGLTVTRPPECAVYDALDGLGDPVAAVPVGPPTIP